MLRVRILLDDGWVIATVKMTDTFDQLLSVANLFWYEFLLRVQSEALVVYKGQPSWESCLPSGIPNAVWIVGTTIHFRLRTRKHRPHGSLLGRTCSCRRMKSPVFCLYHRLSSLLQGLEVGDVVWSFNSHKTLQCLRTVLSGLGMNRAEMLAWKSWRAGRAICMAAQGDSLGTILTAGEWKSLHS